MIISLTRILEEPWHWDYRLVYSSFTCIVSEYFGYGCSGRIGTIVELHKRKLLSTRNILNVYTFMLKSGRIYYPRDIAYKIETDSDCLDKYFSTIKYGTNFHPCVHREFAKLLPKLLVAHGRLP